MNMRTYGQLLLYKGLTLCMQGLNDNGLSVFKRVQKISDKIEDNLLKIHVECSIAEVYRERGLLEKALNLLSYLC